MSEDTQPKEETTVNLIASGYDWTCPKCDINQHEIEAKSEVTCHECHTQYTVDNVWHAGQYDVF